MMVLRTAGEKLCKMANKFFFNAIMYNKNGPQVCFDGGCVHQREKCIKIMISVLKVFVFVPVGGTWWASRALWWATSLSPSTSPASSWAACITLIICPEPCTSGSLTSKTCPSNSPSTAPCSAVRQHHAAGSHLHSLIIENGMMSKCITIY